jgi:large subunit ribosomal protein L28
VSLVAAGRCDICQRIPQYGHNVSHAENKTNRRFVLNIQRRRLMINGTLQNVNICTRCLRTMNKVEKPRGKKARAIVAAQQGGQK